MGLPTAQEGGLRPPIIITWMYNNEPMDLTGAAISARIYNYADKITRNSNGVFNVLIPLDGVFEWQLSEEDATAGNYKVQFVATFPSGLSPLRSNTLEWIVKKSL